MSQATHLEPQTLNKNESVYLVRAHPSQRWNVISTNADPEWINWLRREGWEIWLADVAGLINRYSAS